MCGGKQTNVREVLRDSYTVERTTQLVHLFFFLARVFAILCTVYLSPVGAPVLGVSAVYVSCVCLCETHTNTLTVTHRNATL